jgi:hypothetical protein
MNAALRWHFAKQMRVDVPPVPDFTPQMKTAIRFATALLVLSATGCIFGKHKQPPPPPVVDFSPATPATTNTFRVTPDTSAAGRVSSVNKDLRFVVLTFPIGQNPSLGTRMNVFRRGEIVGEIKITGPQRDDNSVADIVLGDAQKGDEVRQK